MARLINAGKPFVSSGLTAARPFFMAPVGTDRQRAVDCLAAAAFYEAGTDGPGQRAVAQVVLNRLRMPFFPASVCGVVFQGSERSTGCQFTFTCDGSMARRTPSARAWSAAQLMAEQMLLGRVEPAVGLATHYHTDWVAPVWSRDMDKLAAVGTHLFFRWPGQRGGPDAFRRSEVAAEPRIAAMARISSAHAPALPTLADAAPDGGAGSAFGANSGFVQPPSPARHGRLFGETERLPGTATMPGPEVFLVTLSPGAGADAFLRIARQHCAGAGPCRVIGWTDPQRAATRLPMPGSAVDAISFTFVRRSGSGLAEASWNCAEFPREDTSQCLRRGT